MTEFMDDAGLNRVTSSDFFADVAPSDDDTSEELIPGPDCLIKVEDTGNGASGSFEVNMHNHDMVDMTMEAGPLLMDPSELAEDMDLNLEPAHGSPWDFQAGGNEERSQSPNWHGATAGGEDKVEESLAWAQPTQDARGPSPSWLQPTIPSEVEETPPLTHRKPHLVLSSPLAPPTRAPRSPASFKSPKAARGGGGGGSDTPRSTRVTELRLELGLGGLKRKTTGSNSPISPRGSANARANAAAAAVPPPIRGCSPRPNSPATSGLLSPRNGNSPRPMAAPRGSPKIGDNGEILPRGMWQCPICPDCPLILANNKSRHLRTLAHVRAAQDMGEEMADSLVTNSHSFKSTCLLPSEIAAAQAASGGHQHCGSSPGNFSVEPSPLASGFARPTKRRNTGTVVGDSPTRMSGSPARRKKSKVALPPVASASHNNNNCNTIVTMTGGHHSVAAAAEAAEAAALELAAEVAEGNLAGSEGSGTGGLLLSCSDDGDCFDDTGFHLGHGGGHGDAGHGGHNNDRVGVTGEVEVEEAGMAGEEEGSSINNMQGMVDCPTHHHHQHHHHHHHHHDDNNADDEEILKQLVSATDCMFAQTNTNHDDDNNAGGEHASLDVSTAAGLDVGMGDVGMGQSLDSGDGLTLAGSDSGVPVSC